MPLRVGCCCSYLAGNYDGAASHITAACLYIKAIKAKKPFKRYADVPVRGTLRRLTMENRDDAIKWFGLQAADILESAGVEPPYLLVPVPSGAAALKADVKPRTVLLADALDNAVGSAETAVLDTVRWDEPLKSAHENGPRFAEELYPHIRFKHDPPKGERCVLVDDVLTSGGHFKAIRAAMERKGCRVIYGVCAGRTVHAQVADSWAVVNETLDDWTAPRSIRNFFR